MGFPPRWVKWVEGVLISARSSVLVNGSPTFDFKCEKGMRQGDPLSPFLFLMVMEALSCMLNKACSLGAFDGFKMSNNGPLISHLLYVDDAIFIGEFSTFNIKNVDRLLRCFHVCSRLKINMFKSCIYGIEVDDLEVIPVASVLGCQIGKIPFVYLGLLVGANMNRINIWRDIFHTVENRLAKWKAISMSIGGRVTLIKSVLESLPTYYFSLYKAPVAVLNGLESIFKKFL
ncbi:putative RNA-directed DNA polymerase [Helianthus annuus]|nr:putative RNA-directed DNA polymerase [Helianthus annuus]